MSKSRSSSSVAIAAARSSLFGLSQIQLGIMKMFQVRMVRLDHAPPDGGSGCGEITGGDLVSDELATVLHPAAPAAASKTCRRDRAAIRGRSARQPASVEEIIGEHFAAL